MRTAEWSLQELDNHYAREVKKDRDPKDRQQYLRLAEQIHELHERIVEVRKERDRYEAEAREERTEALEAVLAEEFAQLTKKQRLDK